MKTIKNLTIAIIIALAILFTQRIARCETPADQVKITNVKGCTGYYHFQYAGIIVSLEYQGKTYAAHVNDGSIYWYGNAEIPSAVKAALENVK